MHSNCVVGGAAWHCCHIFLGLQWREVNAKHAFSPRSLKINIMKCPRCGAAELVLYTRDIRVAYKAQSTIIPVVTGEFSVCGEAVLSREDGDGYSDFLRKFHEQVDACGIRISGARSNSVF